MPLRLRQAVAGKPNNESSRNLDVITVGERGYIVYPSTSNVVLLTPELVLADTLQFWAALPHRASSSHPGNVHGVCCSSPDGLILAWSEVHVVIWRHLSSKGNAGWTVHSTILASSPITCLDFNSGTLAIGTQNGIEYWRLNPGSEVVVWDRLWESNQIIPTSFYHMCLFRIWAPGVVYKRTYISIRARYGSEWATGREDPGDQTSARDLLDRMENAFLRKIDVEYAFSTDSHLYTITTNSVFRIYSPVLDDPSWFQLLSSLDHKAFARSSPGNIKGKGPELNPFGAMWAWDADTLRAALKVELDRGRDQKTKIGSEVMSTLEALTSEESDVVAWAGPDGTISLRSILNMERKPPTLLKTLPLAKVNLPSSSSPEHWSPYARLLHVPGSIPSLVAVLAPNDQHQSVGALRLSIAEVLANKSSGITSAAPSASSEEIVSVQLEHPIDHFVRTPNGRGLLAIGEQGEIGTWYKQQLSLRPSKWHSGPKSLVGKGHWNVPVRPSRAAIFAKGRAIVFYIKPEDGSPPTITLQHLDRNSITPTIPLTLPHFSPTGGDDVQMLLAVSDIDDGHSNKGRRTQRAIIMAVTRQGEAWVWRVVSRITPKEEQLDERPDVFLLSHYRLPIGSAQSDAVPHMVLPVDPMGWHQSVIDWTTDLPLQDMVLTISQGGDLEFWTPKLGAHLVGETGDGDLARADAACRHDGAGTGATPERNEQWIRTSVVNTDRKNVVGARCSSRKKTALVCELPDGRHEITIWDSKVSEFSTGLELTHIFEAGEEISDLDWTTTSDLQSVLAVGFAHKVVLICEQRMSYAEVTPGWAPFLTIDMERYTSVPISDSIWLAGGSLAVGAGNQIYLFSRFLGRDSPVPSPAGSARSIQLDEEEPEDIFQLIAHRNGPLVDYHPVQLGQCLLWDKADLVKSILLRLAKNLRECQEEGKRRLRFQRLDPSEFYSRRKVAKATKSSTGRYDGLFDVVQPVIEEEEDDFTDRAASELIDRLNGPVAMPLSTPEKSFMATVVQATLEAEQQRRSLDLSGMRYLISLRMYVNWDRLSPGSASDAASDNDGLGAGRRRHHLSFRNIVWAMHSESQDLLLSASTETCENGKMLWGDARRMGVFLWLKPGEAYRSQLENVARNRFMADEDRDPTTCSLVFFALGKKKVVHGLWRQAPGHKEQSMMLKFLANDFELERWKTAALKNAYALLSKQRYEYAAAFFMLAGHPKDAINVCVRHLNDWQLGVALARVVEPAEGTAVGPLLKWILEDTVLPIAFKGGHRWLATWAFWTLGRRDLAVRILISPMNDIALVFSPDKPLEVGNPDNDDPSLLLMFQHLKTKSLQTAKGTSEVSAKLEFDFVLHNARVFFRMGCHNLALDLIRSWSFERPFFPSRAKPKAVNAAPPTPTSAIAGFPSAVIPTAASPNSPARPSLFSGGGSGSYIGHKKRPSFMLTSGGRRESLFMDIDVLNESTETSAVPTPTSERNNMFGNPTVPGLSDAPEPTAPMDKDGGEGEAEDREEPRPATPPRKIGNLMKELKQDVQQGAMEFDMDSFF